MKRDHSNHDCHRNCYPVSKVLHPILPEHGLSMHGLASLLLTSGSTLAGCLCRRHRYRQTAASGSRRFERVTKGFSNSWNTVILGVVPASHNLMLWLVW